MTINNAGINPSFLTHSDFLADWDNFSQLDENFASSIYIEQYVNGKNLACPMPLLKLKMALRNTRIGNSVYVTATDPNSLHDIGAFCRHLGYGFDSSITDTGEKVVHILVQKMS